MLSSKEPTENEETNLFQNRIHSLDLLDVQITRPHRLNLSLIITIRQRIHNGLQPRPEPHVRRPMQLIDINLTQPEPIQ